MRHERNGGPAQARQTTLQASRRRYIAFLDSDDLWLPQKLEHQLDFMQPVQAALSFTQFRRVDVERPYIGQVHGRARAPHLSRLLKNTAIAVSTVIIDRERTGPFQMIRTY